VKRTGVSIPSPALGTLETLDDVARYVWNQRPEALTPPPAPELPSNLQIFPHALSKKQQGSLAAKEAQ